MERRRLAWLFLLLLSVGVFWPVAAGVYCGDCCEGRTRTCGTPTTGFSLCCFHSVSTLPDLPPSGFVSADVSLLAAADEAGGPSPHPRDILHVPRPFLT
jgi:hypothetical protein